MKLLFYDNDDDISSYWLELSSAVLAVAGRSKHVVAAVVDTTPSVVPPPPQFLSPVSNLIHISPPCHLRARNISNRHISPTN